MYIGYKRLRNKRRQKIAMRGNLEDAVEFDMNYELKDHIEKQYDTIDEQEAGMNAKNAILQNPLTRVVTCKRVLKGPFHNVKLMQ